MRWLLPLVLFVTSASALPACKKSTPVDPSCVNGVGPGCPPPPAAALQLICPNIQMEEVKTPTQAVTFPAAHTGGVEPVAKVCTPASGTEFGLGATTVSCNATDASVPAKSATCSFTVTLVPFVPPVPDLRVTKFMAFGDSITRGEIGEPGGPAGVCGADPGPASTTLFMKPQFFDSDLAYPSVVHRLLTTRYANQTVTMANEGRGTEKATTGYLRFPGTLETHRPEVVLLLQGIVDVISTPDDMDPASAPIEALQTDVQEAKSRGIHVLLSTLPPVGNGFQVCNVQNSTIRAANDHIRDLAARENVHLVDIYPLFVGRLKELQGTDGLHPNEAGQRAIGELFFEVIKKNFEIAATGVPGSALSRPQVEVRPPAQR